MCVRGGSQRAVETIPYNHQLPILGLRDRIVGALRKHRVLVVTGAPGCGKSTQLPLMCLEAGRGRRGMVGVSQPRRIAATSLARRVARQFNAPVGGIVGYQTRFQSAVDRRKTVVKFMTDGILLAESARDNLLKGYDTIIVDEVHERTLTIDFLLGHLRRLLRKRPELNVIISSATLDATLFSRAFGKAPVIEVPGRLYPVEVLYSPVEASEQEEGYVEAAAAAVRDCLGNYASGDVLVFMPTEKDILRTVGLLRKARVHADIHPLYARLSGARQDAVFRTADRRKVVVATNIAETSLTIPGIRFVVDTGLARIKRFVPHARVTRLPVEPVSRASADQRRGRCGRVREGVCIRLYAEEDYLNREAFSSPEILRSNLSDVLLRLEASRMGPVEKFPFVKPPPRRAVRDGYAHLRELGALTERHRLTRAGAKMARMPLDPHLAAMLLEAKKERVLPEMRVIVAALSVPDPRRRPPEKQADADYAHRTFAEPNSDFLTLLTLWHSFFDSGKQKTASRGEKAFCRRHYLSYGRMREWLDVHRQLCRMPGMGGGSARRAREVPFDPLHRAILAGLVSNVARKTDQGTYRAARGRELEVFPGSVLFGERPPWIVFHEVVETTRLYARSLAKIDPLWVEKRAPQLCRYSWGEPAFDPSFGNVSTTETVSIFDLPLVTGRRVNYAKVNRRRAREVFIEQALVREQLQSTHGFYVHNRRLREEVRRAEAKLRRRDVLADEDQVYRFYDAGLGDITSVQELNREVKRGADRGLRMRREDLLRAEIPGEVKQYPDHLTIGGKRFPLEYRFAPGDARDGVTLKVAEPDASFLNPDEIDWELPGVWNEKIYQLLRGLPRSYRRSLAPIRDTAEAVARNLERDEEGFAEAVRKSIAALRGVDIPRETLAMVELPPHLQVHLEVTRPSPGSPPASADWREEFRARTVEDVREWSFGDVPERVSIGAEGEGKALWAYPALQRRGERVDLVLCKSRRERERVHPEGVRALVEKCLSKELSWLPAEVRLRGEERLRCAAWCAPDTMEAVLCRLITGHVLDVADTSCRTGEQFEESVNAARVRLRETVPAARNTLERLLDCRERCVSLITSRRRNVRTGAAMVVLDELERELADYLGGLTAPHMNFRLFQEYPRYLRTLETALERGTVDVAGYREKRRRLEAFLPLVERFRRGIPRLAGEARGRAGELLYAFEEFRISVFAQQQVGARIKISEKRLEKFVAAVEEAVGKSGEQQVRRDRSGTIT